MDTAKNKTIFENGALWLRADFHLHTKADKAFIYEDDANYFVSKYIAQLKSQNIKIGVITNHNKFDLKEFKELRKNAEKDEIYLLPGVEFSVKDGAKGLHVLIVFEDSWVYNSENTNYIQSLLDSSFTGITSYDSPPYKNSKCDLKMLYDSLNGYGKDYFFVLAHIDDSNGCFAELEGRNLEDFLKSETFEKKVFALQKSRTIDNQKKLTAILGKQVPAFVEGTDNAEKGISGIGLGNEVKGTQQKTFIKLGGYNFDAVKYALRDHLNRVSNTMPETNQAYLKSIVFTTGKWKSRKISFNPAMNNLIGIRGSGKSTILETVRYALDIPIGKNVHEQQYKERLVQNFLGSGGKMEIELIDKHGKTYIAEKIYGESTNIYQDGQLQHNLRANAIINQPLYYGQKDLSDIGGETSTEDLISKLTTEKLSENNTKIEDKVGEIMNILTDLQKVNKQLRQKEDIEVRKAAIEKDMKVFQDLEIDKKLNRQIDFNKDSNRLDTTIEFENDIITAINEFYDNFEDSFDGLTDYESKENVELFKEVHSSFDEFHKAFSKIAEIIKELETGKSNLDKIRATFKLRYEELKEEFSEIKRTINLPNIEADTYVKLSKELDLQNAKLIEIEKLNERRKTLVLNLNKGLVSIRKLWHAEYELITEEIKKLNLNQSSLRIDIEFKGNKERFKEFIRDSVRGSGIRENAISDIAEHYPDLIGIYEDFGVETSKINTMLSGGNNLTNFKTKFNENISAFLTYRVPDKFTVYYKDRPLQEHSLGQRASALILFILTLKENDLIIIDQPEDDLDNQTIYSDVITQLKKIKGSTQFIFATHNPNIPVLGDCEQIISCDYSSDHIEAETGSIDDTAIQKKIVNIMEGGEEAFNQRKMIYDIWKH